MKFLTTLLIGVAACHAARAHAEETSAKAPADLPECLVKATTEADKRILVRWVFSDIAAHPYIKDMVALSTPEQEAIDASAAALFERLMAKDCTAQVGAALASGDTQAFEKAFETFGQMAMAQVFEHPDVSRGVERMGERIDTTKIIKALLTR